LQNVVNLASPPLASSRTDNAGSVAILSAFEDKPFEINDYIPTPAAARTAL
jgi:hypothetical protein